MTERIAPAADRDYFAAYLNLRGKRGIVVGGGPVAALKAETLLRSGAQVTVVAPELCPRLAELTLVGALRHEAKRFQPGDLVGAEITIAATDDPAVNEAVSAAARSLRIPVNVADNAALSSFIMPSVIDRPPLQIAISTAGASPVLARKLRTLIESLLPFAYGRLAALAARFRAASKRRYPEPDARRRFWEDVMDGPVAEMMLAGREPQAVEMLERMLEGGGNDTPAGMVYLVGGGPGDEAVRDNSRVIDWVRKIHATTTWTTSVCTGSLILAKAGILDGKKATSHFASLDTLVELGATLARERVVIDGKVVTGAGVSAGIDMALHLAGAIAGDDYAKALQLGIEYAPEPPYDAGSPAAVSADLVELVRGALLTGRP